MIDAAFLEIAKLIDTTNNGKLLVINIPFPLRDNVERLVKRGYLRRATFVNSGDAVRLA
jgi:hypothetical protein